MNETTYEILPKTKAIRTKLYLTKLRLLNAKSKLIKNLEGQLGTSGIRKTVLPLPFVRTASHVNNLDQGRSGAPFRSVSLRLRTPDKGLGESV